MSAGNQPCSIQLLQYCSVDSARSQASQGCIYKEIPRTDDIDRKNDMDDLWYFEMRLLDETEGGGYLIEFSLFPGCIADGETPRGGNVGRC